MLKKWKHVLFFILADCIFADVMRGCSKVRTTKCEKSEVSGITGDVCICETELCNGSNVLKPSVAIGILVIAVMLKDFL